MKETLELLRNDATLHQGMEHARSSTALMEELLEHVSVRRGRVLANFPKMRFVRTRGIALRLLLAARRSKRAAALRRQVNVIEDGGNGRLAIDLRGIERFPNATFVRFNGRVRGLRSLIGLPRLQAMRLEGPSVYMLEDLEGLPIRLLLLRRWRGDVLRVPALPKLRLLRLLECSMSQLVKVPTTLWCLDLHTTDVDSVPQLSAMTQLRTLKLSQRPALPVLKSRLTSLSMRQPGALALESVAPSLESLSVTGAPDLTGFSSLRTLTIEDAAALEGVEVPNLEQLTLRRVDSLRGLVAPRLRSLYILGSSLVSLKGLRAPELERLRVVDCPALRDVTALRESPLLREVRFEECPRLKDIECLGSHVTELKLSRTGVRVARLPEHLAKLVEARPIVVIPETRAHSQHVRNLVTLLKSGDPDTIAEAVELTLALDDAATFEHLLADSSLLRRRVAEREFFALRGGTWFRGDRSLETAFRELVARIDHPLAEQLRSQLHSLVLEGSGKPVDIGRHDLDSLTSLAIVSASSARGTVPPSVRSLTLENVHEHLYSVGDVAELRFFGCSGNAPSARRVRQLTILQSATLLGVPGLIASGRVATLTTDSEVEPNALPRTLRELRFATHQRLSLSTLAHLSQLRTLHLSRAELIDVEGLSEFTDLESLALPQPESGIEDAIATFMQLPLKRLLLDGWSGLTVDELEPLAEHPTLQRLEIRRGLERDVLSPKLAARTLISSPLLR